jgi:hypothetical protein
MKFEDVKEGMRVVYTGDMGVVTVVAVEDDGSILIAQTDDACFYVSPEHIEPLEIKPAIQIGFKINPAQKIKKVVEVEEETPETFTFTLSRRAAHELRAILGIMECSRVSQLYSELKSFDKYMADQDDVLTLLGSSSTVIGDEFKPVNFKPEKS